MYLKKKEKRTKNVLEMRVVFLVVYVDALVIYWGLKSRYCGVYGFMGIILFSVRMISDGLSRGSFLCFFFLVWIESVLFCLD